MKIKKLLSLIAAATMAVTALTGAMTAFADTVAEGTCGNSVKWMLDSDGVLTISGEGAMNTVPESAMPDGVENRQLDYSDYYTYKEYKEDIKEVVIEEGVTSIGFCAFYQFPNLETVVIPSTIKEFTQKMIGANGYNHAFAKCTALKNLTLTEGIEHIGGYAFQGCTALESVTIPTSLKDWDMYSFYQCSSLKDITLPEGLKYMGAAAFAETAVRSIVIPSTIEHWDGIQGNDRASMSGGTGAGYFFANCLKLSSVTFTDGLEKIGNRAFQDCPSLKKVFIPKSVTNLQYAFQNCTGLEEAYIENGANINRYNNTSNEENTYFQYAFANCDNLKRLEISESVAIAYNNAKWCDGSKSLTDIYLHAKDYTRYIPVSNETVKFHCYFNTDTYNKALVDTTKIPEDRIVDIEEEIAAYLDMVKTSVDKAKTYDEELYTPESYGVLKALIEKAEAFGEDAGILDMEWTISDINTAIKGLQKKPEEPSSDPTDDPSEPSSDPSSDPSSEPSSDDSSNNPSDDKTEPTAAPTTAKPAPTPTAPTTAAPKATTANNKAVQAAKDKSAAEKVMKQAKITKLTAKAKGKKKIVVSWKKVSKAKGYNVQVSNKKNFKNILVDKTTSKVKLTIKSNKIKSKKTYYVRVRAYATYQDANGKTQKVYSSWIKKTRKVKVK